MKRKKIAVKAVEGDYDLLGWYEPESSPEGLYAVNCQKVYEGLEEQWPGLPEWSIVHHSGFTVAIGFHDRGSALEAMEWLADLTDWSVPRESLLLVPHLEGRVAEALLEFGQGGVA